MKPIDGYNKLRGGYYTPDKISEFITEWAVRTPDDSVLEPSCGDGSFLDAITTRYRALDRKDKHEKERQQSIINYGNLVFGNVSGSTLTVDNSIHLIEQAIDEKGGEDKQELHELLDEVKELIENIQSSRAIPKQKKLFEKISNHMEKHGWFYGAVVQLLGTAALGLIGG